MNDRQIRQEILAGALDVDDVADRCAAGSRCGSCRPVVEALIAESAVSIGTRVVAA